MLADWKKEGFKIPKGTLSIHSAGSVMLGQRMM
jgi:hypothetical protein